MLANDPRLTTKSESHVAKQMKSVAVIKVTIGVNRADLIGLHQDHDEHLPLVFEAKLKLLISQLSVSANVEGGMCSNGAKKNYAAIENESYT